MSTLVGKPAPFFTANAVVNGNRFESGFSLDRYIGKKYVIFFFYPGDFTFVCPSELLAFQDRLGDFERLNTAVVACSVDSHYSHFKWLQTELNQGGIKGVTYPVVADFTKTISYNYGVLAGDYLYNEAGEFAFEGNPTAYRGLFLIDREGMVRHQLVNDMPLGRSVEEAVRMVEALQFFEENGEVCPANWHKGAKGMTPTAEGVADYLANR